VGITGQQMTAMVQQIIQAKEIAGFYQSQQCRYIGVGAAGILEFF